MRKSTHVQYDLQYHLVWTTKYRYKVLNGKIAERTRELNDRERRFYYAFIPISGFYWFCWGLYKGSVGDDDSFFFLPSYRNIVRFVDKAIKSYEM